MGFKSPDCIIPNCKRCIIGAFLGAKRGGKHDQTSLSLVNYVETVDLVPIMFVLNFIMSLHVARVSTCG